MLTTTLPITNEPLVPVRDAQKNLTKQFQQGFVRVTKNGKSLGYIVSDEIMQDILENMAASNPRFIAEMQEEDKDENLTSFEDLKKEYGLNK